MQNTDVGQKKPSQVRQNRIWLRRVIFGALAVVLVPYICSRIISPFRRVSSIAQPAVGDVHSVGPRDRLRVLTYNIAHGRGLAESNWDGGDSDERLSRLEKIAVVLREADADVVILNEVDFDCSWSNGVNQAKFLAEEAGYRYRVEQRNLDFRVLFWTWKFGNAVLSKHPLSNAQVVDIPGYSITEELLAGQKRALRVDIEFGGNDICVIAAHLCHRSAAVRTQSMEVMLEVARTLEGNTFIAGDLNSSPPGFRNTASKEANAISLLDDLNIFQRRPVERPTSPEQFTFRFGEIQTVIDWILIPVKARFADYQVIDTELSDHRPVFAEIRF